MEKIDYLQLVSLLNDFKRIDKKKVLQSIDEKEHKYWSNLQASIMANLYSKPYPHLLNKRNFIRAAVSMPIDYFKGDGDGEGFNSKTMDLSINGICLPINRTVDLEEKMITHIKGKGFLAKKMKIESRLCWKDPISKSMGASFNAVSKKETGYLLDIVHSSLNERLEELT